MHMIGTNIIYTVELYDDVWSQVWSIDCIEQAKHYVHTKRDNGKRYRIVKNSTEVIYETR
jgi:hypothetical protein